MNYFSRITADHWTAKNNLEKAAKQVAYYFERRLIPESEVDKFKDDFRKAVEKINADHPRCKELVLSIWLPEHDLHRKDFYIQISGVFQMEIVEVKE